MPNKQENSANWRKNSWQPAIRGFAYWQGVAVKSGDGGWRAGWYVGSTPLFRLRRRYRALSGLWSLQGRREGRSTNRGRFLV